MSLNLKPRKQYNQSLELLTLNLCFSFRPSTFFCVSHCLVLRVSNIKFMFYCLFLTFFFLFFSFFATVLSSAHYTHSGSKSCLQFTEPMFCFSCLFFLSHLSLCACQNCSIYLKHSSTPLLQWAKT